MHVTFNNRFEIVKMPTGTQRIEYRHNLRCSLKMYLEKRDADPADRDWDIVLEGGSKIITSEFAPRLASDLARYLKRRTKQMPNRINFERLLSLAQIRSIY